MTSKSELPGAFERLSKILALEKRQGYRNKAVIGGLDKFAARWEQDARQEVPASQPLIAEIVSLLTGYPAVSDPETRARVLNDIMLRLSAPFAAPSERAPEPRPPAAGQETGRADQERPRPPRAPANQAPDRNTQAPARPAPPPEPRPRPKSEPPPARAGQPEKNKPAPARQAPPPPERPAQPQQAAARPPKGADKAAGALKPQPAAARPGQTGKGGQKQQPPAKQPAAPAKPSAPERPARGGAPSHPVPERRPPVRRARGLSTGEINLGLQAPVTSLPSIGPHYAELLARLDIATVEDLLWHFPHRYVDYSHLKPIASLTRGEEATVLSTVWEVQERPQFNGRRVIQAIVADGSGTMQVTWFNPYVKNQVKAGRVLALSGKIDLYMGRLVMNNPEWEPLDQELVHTGRMVPMYPLTKDLSQRWLRQRIKQVVDAWASHTTDFLPDRVLASTRLMSLAKALAQIHFPDNAEQLDQARRRLAFNELFMIQLGALRRRQAWRGQPAPRLTIGQTELARFQENLPFTLTGAQQRALDEILHDLQDIRPMSRLLQGDVGSGKTVVAATAMWIAAQNQRQAAMMAPTEILAEQHFAGLTRLLARRDEQSEGEEGSKAPRIALLTGSLRDADKEAVIAQLASGEVQMVVGTHALIQQGVTFANLGLAVVDEQQRFGVEQRAALKQAAGGQSEALTPHLLVMSATPIPRSLALTVYGDLDLSIIDELPPGRQPIKTYVVHPDERERAYSFIQTQAAQGRQAFIICPLVEESEQSDARAAVAEHERLQREVFPRLKLGLLHGRMKGDEKEAVMQAFARNETQVLVSTSVVEVGIDVPNATVMLVEGANHFGLAQLHQFRGRVGRGEHASFCLLLVERTDQTEDERLRAMAQTQDGFKLAEIDLQLRGPGDFLGTRQSGVPGLHMASLGDVRLMDMARAEAQQLLEFDPTLHLPEHRNLAIRLERFWHGQGDVS